MKIWILRPADGLPDSDNPWEPWYDKCFGMVIRAKSEDEARQIAHQEAQCENRGEFRGKPIANTNRPWLDPHYSTCLPISSRGKAALILQDVRTA